MIKVCHMTSAHGEEDGRIFLKECISLAKGGYDVYLVERGESREKNGVHIVGVGEIPSSRLKRMTQGARKVYEAARAIDADIYHFHDPELLPFGLKLKKLGKKVIFDSHENTAESVLEKTWIPKPLRSMIYRIFTAYQAYICRRLDCVVVVSPNAIDYFEGFCRKLAVVTNYPIIQDTPVPQMQNKYVVFAGGISPQWNHERIMRAVCQISDCRYQLCGPGDAAYMQQLQKEPGWQQTDYLGKIPHAQVSALLAQCSVGMALLTPGRNTGFHTGTMGNTKIFEEMMARLPVICTDFDLWKDFVDKYRCGICIDPTDVDQITAAIRYLLDHPDEARQMGENGRRAVKEKFNWGVEEKKLFALYEDILKEA